jgi:ATP-dependent Clp protease ATP-binding subunit ClpC
MEKIATPGGGSRAHYHRKLLGQVAGRLQLLNLACRSLDEHSPWETFIRIEDQRGPAAADGHADAWVDRLGGMYRQWATRRKMRLETLEDRPRRSGQRRSLLLAVTGYAAHAILAPESGLHIWEEPDPEHPRTPLHQGALVRVEPLPQHRTVDATEDLLAAAREAMAAPLAGAPGLVRVYRERPDPLVKDRRRGWRTGRLHRVLDGDFDLLGACAEHDAAAGTDERPSV